MKITKGELEKALKTVKPALPGKKVFGYSPLYLSFDRLGKASLYTSDGFTYKFSVGLGEAGYTPLEGKTFSMIYDELETALANFAKESVIDIELPDNNHLMLKGEYVTKIIDVSTTETITHELEPMLSYITEDFGARLQRAYPFRSVDEGMGYGVELDIFQAGKHCWDGVFATDGFKAFVEREENAYITPVKTVRIPNKGIVAVKKWGDTEVYLYETYAVFKRDEQTLEVYFGKKTTTWRPLMAHESKELVDTIEQTPLLVVEMKKFIKILDPKNKDFVLIAKLNFGMRTMAMYVCEIYNYGKPAKEMETAAKLSGDGAVRFNPDYLMKVLGCFVNPTIHLTAKDSKSPWFMRDLSGAVAMLMPMRSEEE